MLAEAVVSVVIVLRQAEPAAGPTVMSTKHILALGVLGRRGISTSLAKVEDQAMKAPMVAHKAAREVQHIGAAVYKASMNMVAPLTPCRRHIELLGLARVATSPLRRMAVAMGLSL